MTVLNFWVDIENASGVKQGTGPLRARYFTVRKPLSASGDFEFEISAGDPNLSALQEKRVAICRYIDTDGDILDFGGGVIDRIVLAVDENGAQWYRVSGNDLTRELTYRSVRELKLESASAGVTDGPDQIIALAPSGWTIQDGTTVTPVYAGYDGESVLNALLRCGEHIGEHWRLGSGRQIVWLGPASTFLASGVRAVQHVNDPVAAESNPDIVVITSLEEQNDAADLVTRIIPRGSGNGGVISNLQPCTDTAPAGYTLNKTLNYLENDAAVAQYGVIERVIDFKELGPISNTDLDVQNAANMLLQASYQFLERYSIPHRSYSIALTARQILEPGTTLRTVYRQVLDGAVIYDLDDEFNLVGIEQSIDETGLHTTRVTISESDRQAVSDEDYLAGQAQEGTIFAAHQQLGASVDNLTYRDELDLDHDASFRFWLGEEYTTIQRALLRFRVQPLRSTVKSIGAESTTTSAGGAGTHTSASGGSSNPTTSQTGGTTTDADQHQHGINVFDSSAGDPVTLSGSLFRAPSGGTVQVPTTFEGGHDHTIPQHTHTVSVPSHTHGVTIPDHTHDVTPILDTVYGIFEESGANTLALADLVIQLNGGADLLSQVTDIGNGWYQLDITAGLVNSIYRPVQENNEIVVSTAVDKTARLEAQITIRGVIQAVAYS